MAQSELETVLTEHHETDNLDPRTDAPARSRDPGAYRPGPTRQHHRADPRWCSPMAGCTNWPFRVICEEQVPMDSTWPR